MTDRDDPPLAPPRWAESLVRWLDDGIAIPGTRYRIGFDGILGLILPGTGDAVTTAAALSLLWLAVQRGVPRLVLARMALNLAVDALFGVVPVVGDLFDFAWKANRKNLDLLTRTTRSPSKRATLGDIALLVCVAALVLSALALPLIGIGWLVASLRSR